MRRRVRRRSSARGVAGFVRRVMLTIGAFVSLVWRKLRGDIRVVARDARIFIGLGLVLTGLLSVASDRYCDGNASSHYTCTRPSTYYFYPWWAILLVIVGSFLIVLWYLRRKK